uniref:Cytochrome P450 1A n=1 Tax=Pogona vitticeps TaxID=103695 RepID=A0A6J0UH57_9SAUR
MSHLAGGLDMISATEALLATLVFGLIFLILRSYWDPTPQGRKRIPGPAGYPFIGNMLEVGKNPHLSLTQMSRKYGDVMKIHIGTTPVLVLSGLETIRQALVRQGADFMGRPDLYSFRFPSNGQSIVFGHDSGAVWHDRKKLAISGLKSFGSSPSPLSPSMCLVEEHVSQEAECLIKKLQEVMLEKKRLEPSRYIVVSVANVVCAMCFGKRYNHDDQELLNIVNGSEIFSETAASGNPTDFIPLLRYLPGNNMKVFEEFNKSASLFFQNIVKKHYESFKTDSIRDITDSLIAQSEEKKLDPDTKLQLSSRDIADLVNDLFGAGFDTVTTALLWCLTYLTAYPEIQKKIHEDIDEIIGRERKPRLSDRPLLPYTEAFILEMFRHSSFLPFAVPHCTIRNTILNGYYIPKGLCVLINQWQVNHDENLWKDPSSFRPERFLTADGKGIDRVESEKVLMFGLGKRRCIGEQIARWEVFLFLTTLLQELHFSVSEGVKVDLTPVYGLSMKPKRCKHFQVKARSPNESNK